MAAQGGQTQAAIALDLIDAAFAHRTRPSVMTDSKQLSDVEYEEVMSFDGMRWQEVTFAQIEKNADAVFWFAPEAFCYYLPGFLAAGLTENRTDTNAYDSVIGMLDRSPTPEYWDDFFRPCWTLLTPDELDAVAAWVTWLEQVLPGAFHANSYDRARDTLKLLRQAGGGGAEQS